MATQPTFLVCPPDHFGVEYVINPWMEGNVHRASQGRAAEQWRRFHETLRQVAGVEVIPPQPGVPDLVFTANAGLLLERQAVLGHFLCRERRPEEPLFRQWLEAQGYAVRELPADLPFEGEGDALFDGARGCLWAGYGLRTELEVHPLLAEWLGVEVVSLRLVDQRFYHLDTCLAPLEGGRLLYYPRAFDARSVQVIEERVPAEQRLVVGEADALSFACNAVNVGRTVIVNRASADLRRRLEAAGYRVVQTQLTEFVKAGGAAKCLALRLEQPALEPAARRAHSSVVGRTLQLEGHLLDTGLLVRALEQTLQAGGSFRVLHFELGRQRQSLSRARVKVSAPHAEALERIAGGLIALGGAELEEDERDAEWRAVTQPGVAPEGFYATTIYPTEVRVRGQWVPVDNARMDGVILAGGDPGSRPGCALLRDLQVADQVVVGTAGVRTLRRPGGGSASGEASGPEDFAFMGAGVSSERRVEVVVDRIAWEMHRIRERGGRIIVVPGPVVIHTGGGGQLAWLVREGYVHGLLGGNAIAVHDIEQALLGTSLGVDLQRGTPVRGGHSHHLRVINAIRRAGGIQEAVRQGVLRSGVLYECVVRGVPFVLAGSIRDDGPLPEVHMDLVRAQAEYAALVRGADMVLMLATMLHAIGVGNMTPAGVRLVCVDINPATVTKLADRGSLESVGVVTDVGLFLGLLTQQLRRLRE
ncbi:MAG: TIGR00300 family protein [Candidatus Latescibacterota bacterium]